MKITTHIHDNEQYPLFHISNEAAAEIGKNWQEINGQAYGEATLTRLDWHLIKNELNLQPFRPRLTFYQSPNMDKPRLTFINFSRNPELRIFASG